VVRGVVLAICFGVVTAGPAIAEPQVAGQSKTCNALEIPQIDTGYAVVGTYAGQQFEFRITVDGKPITTGPQQALKEVKSDCAYTS